MSVKVRDPALGGRNWNICWTQGTFQNRVLHITGILLVPSPTVHRGVLADLTRAQSCCAVAAVNKSGQTDRLQNEKGNGNHRTQGQTDRVSERKRSPPPLPLSLSPSPPRLLFYTEFVSFSGCGVGGSFSSVDWSAAATADGWMDGRMDRRR